MGHSYLYRWTAKFTFFLKNKNGSVKLGIFVSKKCKLSFFVQYILARGLKLYQLIDDDDVVKLKKKYFNFFFSYCPLKILTVLYR